MRKPSQKEKKKGKEEIKFSLLQKNSWTIPLIKLLSAHMLIFD